MLSPIAFYMTQRYLVKSFGALIMKITGSTTNASSSNPRIRISSKKDFRVPIITGCRDPPFFPFPASNNIILFFLR